MSTPPPPRSCPICGRPAGAAEWRPFCSAACKDRDLLAWAAETYRVPVRPGQDAEAEEAAERAAGEAGAAAGPRESAPRRG